MNQADITLVSTADWDHPLWTNKQHVAQTLANLSYRVLYIESTGSRGATFSTQDNIRIAKRLFNALRGPRKAANNLWILSPLLIPGASTNLARLINKLIFRAQVNAALLLIGLRKDVLWTYSPNTSQLLKISYWNRSLYHCVDAIDHQPLMDSRQIRKLEAQLMRHCDMIACSSRGLYARAKSFNSNTFYYPNAVDIELFAQARSENTSTSNDLRLIPSPRIVLIGSLVGYKVDFSMLELIAKSFPHASLVLIGSIKEGAFTADLSQLLSMKNVFYLGVKHYTYLPSILKGATVAIIPALINNYTDYMFPMKFFEYLAAGVPVVATGLSAISEFRHWANICHDKFSFIQAIKEIIDGGNKCQASIKDLHPYSYKERTIRMIDSLLKS
jgi:glycosyltransferase involved in cell wall biosynthesis